MSKPTKESALDLIRANIARHGHHVYLISGNSPLPRYVYTIGLSERIGAEIILAGAAFFSGDEAVRIVNGIAAEWSADRTSFALGSLGGFSLRKADPTWINTLMLGALDFYRNTAIHAWQVVPDQAHWTVDVPDMGKSWSASSEPVWQWKHTPWTFPVPKDSAAITDLAALRGARVSEAARWEEDEWELFAGEGASVTEDEARRVPLGTLLGADPSLLPVTSLAVGKGLWRDPEKGEWEVLGS